jgi:uncharacterized protein (DUF2141 family)
MLIRHIALLSVAGLCLSAAEATELRITLHNVMPKQGEVLVTLFDHAQGFPDQPSTTQPSRRLQPDSDTLSVTFSNLPQGRWAVMVLQDLNGNGRADYNLVGFPKEPYGASNNKLPRLSPPTFEDALVTVGSQAEEISIKLRRP